MRTLIHIFILVVGLFTGVLLAFIPGPSTIRECPNCGQQVEEGSTLSGNLFGARFWTDGKREAPMLPGCPLLVKCPACSSIFWIDEAKKLGEKPNSVEAYLSHDSLISKWKDSEWPDWPSEQDYYSVLDSLTEGGKKERYMRIMAWWKFNDAYRDSTAIAPEELTPQVIDNLEHLYDILSIENLSDRIMKAEVARELGRFQDCLDILKYLFPKNLENAVTVIKKCALEKDTRVKELK